MKLQISIDDSDVTRLQGAFEKWRQHEFVQERLQLILGDGLMCPNMDAVWQGMALALTTSQQRSGPGSRVDDLWRATPCPVALADIEAWKPNIASSMADFLKNWGGIRYYNRIGEFVEANYRTLLEDGNLQILQAVVDQLWSLRQSAKWDDGDSQSERRVCSKVLALGLKGIGKKQVRNWLLNSRLLRYEFPIDSRVLKFLRPMTTTLPLNQSLLFDESYYYLVEDVVQELCKRAGMFPCVADAVMFLAAGEAIDSR